MQGRKEERKKDWEKWMVMKARYELDEMEGFEWTNE